MFCCLLGYQSLSFERTGVSEKTIAYISRVETGENWFLKTWLPSTSYWHFLSVQQYNLRTTSSHFHRQEYKADISSDLYERSISIVCTLAVCNLWEACNETVVLIMPFMPSMAIYCSTSQLWSTHSCLFVYCQVNQKWEVIIHRWFTAVMFLHTNEPN